MARLILLVVVVLLVVWLLRSLRRPHRGADAAPPPPAAPAQDMVACEQCGVHLPRDEALPGRGGVFCCEEHRRQHEHERGS